MKITSEYFKWLMARVVYILLLLSVLSACTYSASQSSISLSKNSPQSVPDFDHIVVVTFENKDFNKVIGNLLMPTYNGYARKYALLTRFYAITHPSLPNYIAMIGGDTFKIDTNCVNCFVDAKSLPDLIEASGRTWKT